MTAVARLMSTIWHTEIKPKLKKNSKQHFVMILILTLINRLKYVPVPFS